MINLEDYSPEQLESAIFAKRKMEKYQDKSLLDQFLINVRNKGYSITTVVALLAGGGAWNKEHIRKWLNPDITQEEIATANSSNEMMMIELRLLLKQQDTKLKELLAKQKEGSKP